ncbi:MAG: hypothetical protein KFE21_00475 [Candidatus Sulcia muelleri]|nr:hypothetical protein [Candidatus Karelsulcia muelleri]
MERKKIECPYCKKDVFEHHYTRHYNSKNHLKNKDIYEKELNYLRNWAKENQIDGHEKMYNIEKLRELKKSFKEDKKDLNLFNDEKIQSIAEKLSIETNDKTKSEMIEEIDKTLNENPENIIDVEVLSSIHGLFKQYILTNLNDNSMSIYKYLSIMRPEIKSLIEKFQENVKNMKGYLSLECEYERTLVNGETQTCPMYFTIKADEIFDINDFITKQFNKLTHREQTNHPNKGSGWTLKRCKQLVLSLNKHEFMNAGSYIDLPQEIKVKKACVNIKNKDDFCFVYSIRCAMGKPEKNADRAKQYEKFVNDEIFSGFEYPMSLKDIQLFEKRSSNSKYKYPKMSINIYTYDEKLNIVPLQISEVYNAELEIDEILLFFQTIHR